MAEPLSILDKIIESEKTKQLQDLDVETEVEFLLKAPKIKKDREREVIRFRYGLDGEKAKTLEEIGKSLNITRERVRQIEKSAYKKIADYVAEDKRAIKVLALLTEQVEKLGGVATFQNLANMILRDDKNRTKSKNNLAFLMFLNKNFIQVSESHELKRGVILKSIEMDKITNLIVTAVEILENAKRPVEEMEMVKKIRSKGFDFESPTIASALALSKKILKTEEGHFGLSHWRDINPKSIKDKTFYILKKHKKPLHFSEISKHIENLDSGKKVTKQAVHNELIRDERFVLIGRGIYALAEWGYNKGVIEEVIVEVLTIANKPLHKDDIIKEVLKQRIVKETTVLLNLQKPKFKRIARATYALSDWRE